MKGNFHAQFGERDRETRAVRTVKVRPVPTPFSPALANLALNGLEHELHTTFARSKLRRNAKVHLVRYADDFVRHEARDEYDAKASAARRRVASLSP